MRRRGGVLIAGLAVVLTAVASSAAAAGVVTPPAGTPNLALMVIQPPDLVPGATLGGQGYLKPPSGFTAYYGSVFDLASTADGVKYDSIEDYIALAPDATAANLFFAGQEATFATARGRKRLVKSLLKENAKHGSKKDRLKAKDITFTAAGSAGIGATSFIETINFKLKHGFGQQVVLLFDTGTIDVSLVLTGPLNEQIPQSDAIALGNTINAHITSVLATPAGATGATGAT